MPAPQAPRLRRKFGRRIAALLVLFVAVLPPARASEAPSPPAGRKFFVRAGAGIGLREPAATLSFSRPIYAEPADFRLAYSLKRGGSFEAAIGAALSRSLGIEAGACFSSRDLTETASLSIPHPLWMGAPRSKTVPGPALELDEMEIFLNLLLTVRLPVVDLTLSGGPCFLSAKATVVSDVKIEETGYPYLDFDASAATTRIRRNVLGAAGGAALSIDLGPRISVGLGARYVAGSVSFKPAGDIPELRPALGGWRIGGGIKLRG